MKDNYDNYLVISKGRIKTYFLPAFIVQVYEDSFINVLTGKHTKPKPGELVKLIQRIENLVSITAAAIANDAITMIYSIGKIVILHDAYTNIVKLDVPKNISFYACGINSIESFVDILSRFGMDEPY